MPCNFLDELRWRGMLHDAMPGTDDQLRREMTTAYIGFDPTAASLHIGNLATIMLLVHFQRAGHKPIALVGGATGMIGDPSGKSAEREFLSEEILRRNQESIRRQLEKFLEFSSGENAAEIVNNYDWFREFSFLGFLREAGKFLTVNYMMAKDSVRNRLETGISFTEFSYQLLQGYDFYWLYKNKGVKLQMGGSDQWGNITTGTELIRRKEATGEETGPLAFALTTPLVTKADGTKFGKSESGNVWLDPALTSPYQFYQFWLNAADADCPRLLRVFTLLPQAEIEALEASHAAAPHLRLMQKALAQDVTTRVHSEADYETALLDSEAVFKNDVDYLKSQPTEKTEQVFLSLPKTTFYLEQGQTLEEYRDLPAFLSVASGSVIFPSKSEVRRALPSGSISVNGITVKESDSNRSLSEFGLIHDKYFLIKHGKKKFYVIEKKEGQ